LTLLNLKELKSKEGTLTFAYDPLDRLTTLEKKGQWQKRYVYDAFNRRLYEEKFNWNAESNKWQPQGRENFIYSEQKEIGSFGKNKELKSFRAIDPTKESEHGSAFLFELEGKSYVPLYDHRGSVTALYDPQTGVARETYRYSAFGEEGVYNSNLEKVKSSALSNPWRFASKRICEDSKFSYFGERYYDAKQGIWITTDPNGFGDGPNLYAYVHNSPLSHADLYGLSTEEASSLSDSSESSSSSGGREGSFSSRAGGFIRDCYDKIVEKFDFINASRQSDGCFPNNSPGSFLGGLITVYNNTRRIGNEVNFLMGLIQGPVFHEDALSLAMPFGPGGAALNVNAQKALNQKMKALQGAGKTAVSVKTLPDGRVRYYEPEKLSRTAGPTRGSAYVTEYTSSTGRVKSWYESYNHNGNVNRVHPKNINGQEIKGPHYPPTKSEVNVLSKK
jgi:RHS repeat-associated protein